MSDGSKGPPAWVWILVVLGGGFLFLAVAAPLAIYGARKYMANAKTAEATAALVGWGDGLVRCGEADTLPPSSSPVPPSLAAIAGKMYHSAPTEWSEPAHTCARFSMTSPQYFQYAWELTAANAGTLHARADLDGDGVADVSLDMPVLCEAGKCQRMALTDARGSVVPTGKAGTASSSSGGSSQSTGGKVAGVLAVIWGGLCVLASLGASIGIVVAAFGQSMGWGLVVFFVPCGSLFFVANHWERTKKLFFWQLGSFGALIVGVGLLGGAAAVMEGDAGAIGGGGGRSVSGEPAASGALAAPTRPVAPAVPIPALDGASVDLSTVMGGARRLANGWQPEASLLGVEANLLGGKIPTQDGGTATVSFGPSPFASEQAPSGLFVVVYDKSGLHGAPAKGRPGKPLAEPMCAPEGVWPRLDDAFKGSAITLRYGLDGSQRPAWLVSLPGDPKPLRAFAPDDCSPRGTFVARPKH